MTGIVAQASELHLIGVAVGAGFGAVCRAGLDRAVTSRVGSTRLPWATLAVNIIGSFILGLMLGWSQQVGSEGSAEQAQDARALALVIGTGFAGGLTTFSTFSWESWSLIRESHGRGALAYAALTIGLGLAAVALGTSVGQAVG
jgi:CrcB protein